MSSSGLRKEQKRLPQVIAWVLVIVWAAVIFTLSSIPGTSYPSHPEPLNVVAHFLLYFAFAVLVTYALGHSKLSLWKVALIAIAIASLYCASDEFHQSFVDFRNSDIMDWFVDTIAAIVGTAATIFYLSAKKVSHSRRRDGEGHIDKSSQPHKPPRFRRRNRR